MIRDTCCDCGAPFMREWDATWKVRCLPCWAARKARHDASPARLDAPIVDELRDRIRSLLMLTHPDRHGGSALATSTTAWLLDVRERIETSEAA